MFSLTADMVLKNDWDYDWLMHLKPLSLHLARDSNKLFRCIGCGRACKNQRSLFDHLRSDKPGHPDPEVLKSWPDRGAIGWWKPGPTTNGPYGPISSVYVLRDMCLVRP